MIKKSSLHYYIIKNCPFPLVALFDLICTLIIWWHKVTSCMVSKCMFDKVKKMRKKGTENNFCEVL